MSVKIITDSTAYIPNNLLEMYDITVVSLHVVLNSTSYPEVQLSNETFYTQLSTLPLLPSSSQPLPIDMETAFEKLVAHGHQVLGIFLSSDMSGTFTSAHLIKNLVLEKYPNACIELLDSRTNCMQMGFMAIEAAKASMQGACMEDCIHVAKHVLDHSRFLFAPDTLSYLQKGGRIGGASALIGNLLQIKPILTVSDGKTEVFTKVRTKKKVISAFIDQLQKDLQHSNELVNVIVHHINREDEGKALAKLIESSIQKPVDIQSIGPVIGVHVGPGSIGVVYQYK